MCRQLRPLQLAPLSSSAIWLPSLSMAAGPKYFHHLCLNPLSRLTASLALPKIKCTCVHQIMTPRSPKHYLLWLSELLWCSVNPARSFGPAAVAHSWQQQWIFWVGPFGGAIIAAAGYDICLRHYPLPTVIPKPINRLFFYSIVTICRFAKLIIIPSEHLTNRQYRF